MSMTNNGLFIHIALALAYFLGGSLGHLLETPPSNISPIWPAAGVALAGIMVYGNRVLPGLFLGAVFTQVYAFFDASSFDKMVVSSAIGVSIGFISLLQALFGGYLVNRFVGSDDPLITEKKILRFVFLAGPIGCVVSPSLGVSLLYFNGVIDLADMLSSWMAWWVGDAIGVIIVTPLLLLFIAQPRKLWNQRKRFVAYPLFLSLLVVVVIFEYNKRVEFERLDAAFKQQVNLLHEEISHRFEQHLSANLALKAFFDNSSLVERHEFEHYAKALLKAYPYLQALEWTPRVDERQRRSLEEHEQFVIKERAGNGVLAPSRPRPFYYPIYFVEPVAGNEPALGFDISSNHQIQAVINPAIERGVPVATGGIHLIQDREGSPLGIVLYSPVYEKNRQLETREQRRQYFLGFAATVFRVADELDDVVGSLPNTQLSITVRDSEQQEWLYSNLSASALSAPNYRRLVENRLFNFAGRVWVIAYQPSANFYASQQTWAIWWLLLGGILLCGLTSLGALLLTGKAAGIEFLVEKKTRDLKKINRHLNDEIKKREQLQAEQSIKNSVLERLTKSDALPAIMDLISSSCERLYPGQGCAIFVRDDSRRLRLGSAPSLPDFYVQAVEGLSLGDENNNNKSTAFFWQAVIVEDILKHPYWRKYRKQILKTPFRAYWSHPILASDGRALGVLAMYQGERHRPSQEELGFIKSMARLAAIAIEHKLSERELLIAATTFQSHEGIIVTEPNGAILRVNKAFTEITGYSPEEVIGENPRLLSSGLHNNDYYRSMYRALAETGQWQGEIWNRNKSGHIFPERLTLTVVKNPQGEIINYVGIFSDISEIKAAEKEIHDLAYYDPLTSLPNRRLLLDRLGHEIASARKNHCFGALFFLDLDRFKTLNDSLGHHVGDELLIQVAERLRSQLTVGDTVYRLGGDEFIVLVRGNSPALAQAAEKATQLAEQILAEINLPFTVYGSEWHFSTSIGVTLYPEITEQPEAIIQQADTAMYWAKESGRNCISFFKPSMQEHADKRLTLEQELRRALQEGQLRMYYQSQVDQEGRAVSAEALLRWRHPEKGLLLPSEFIPLAEESQLILLLGQWVLTEVCRQAKEWALQGKLIGHVAINVSSKQFRQADFVSQVQTALLDCGLSAEYLMIELTEGCVIENMEDTIAKMQALEAMGVRLSIDDFGIGYSSLLYLKKLPLSQLKIDQSFVRDVDTNPSDAVIVETIIHMAKNLGLHVIAEGVETEQQLAVLKAKGCFLYQGYYFSEPTPGEKFEFSGRTLVEAG